MAAGEASGLPPLEEATVRLGRIPALLSAHNSLRAPKSNVGASLAIGLLVPFLLSLMISKTRKKGKVRAVTCEVGGDPGIAKRNLRFLRLVEMPWEGTDTLADPFEHACHQAKGNKCLGTREFIKMETETSNDGRRLEKVTLGKYSWLTYFEVLTRVENFASGLVARGHKEGERVAICAET